MKTLPLTDARRDLPSLIDKAGKEPILITRYGEEAAVLISPLFYEKALDAMEELEDIAAYDSAKARKESSVIWAATKRKIK